MNPIGLTVSPITRMKSPGLIGYCRSDSPVRGLGGGELKIIASQNRGQTGTMRVHYSLLAGAEMRLF